VDRAAERVLSAMLPVLDSFDAALAIEARTETEEQLLRGMRSTRTQLMDVLAREGLEPIETVGMPFDPEVHEAVMTSGGDGSLVVSEELRRGYRLRGRVLRAALVALEQAD
ncbi:MAG: nucleotide exchange factor GrpE, partial [Acidimicrobiia bacterium]